MRGHVLERLVQIDEFPYEFSYLRDKLRLAPVYPRLARKQHDLVLYQVVIRRERNQPRIGSDIDSVPNGPPASAIDRK